MKKKNYISTTRLNIAKKKKSAILLNKRLYDIVEKQLEECMATCRRQTANSGTYCTGTLLVSLLIYSMEQSP
jgi:hypothetical protein